MMCLNSQPNEQNVVPDAHGGTAAPKHFTLPAEHLSQSFEIGISIPQCQHLIVNCLTPGISFSFLLHGSVERYSFYGNNFDHHYTLSF
jgi:hypothetical protein